MGAECTIPEMKSHSFRFLAMLFSGLLPFVAFLWHASAYGYWLDGAEFVAVSWKLGIAHPPGHPLAALCGNLFRFLPFGPIALRIAWASAFFAAASACFLYLLFERQLVWLGFRAQLPRTVLCVIASWWTVMSFGWAFQGLRPEVYALQAFLSCFILERATAIEFHGGKHAKALLSLAFAMGLALCNHHFLALVMLPALVPTLYSAWIQLGPKLLRRGIAAGLLGLAIYVYLPLRALAGSEPRLGNPTNLANFWWVITAKAFQKNTGDGVPQPLLERFFDVVVVLVQSLNGAVVILALLGLYVLCRVPAARRYAYLWAMLLGTCVMARAWLGFVRSNPDALGYLALAHIALVVLALCFVATLFRLAQERSYNLSGTKYAVAWALLLMLTAYGSWTKVAHASLKDFAATDTLLQGRYRDLPPSAVVVAHAPQTIFQYWGAEAEQNTRPDVTILPSPFLSYPQLSDDLAAQAPYLSELLDTYAAAQRYAPSLLESLAAEYPVFVELDPRVLPDLVPQLAPWGLLYRVVPGGSTSTDVEIAARSQQDYFRQLDAEIASGKQETETRRQLLWFHYMDALFYAAAVEPELAEASVDAGLELEPLAQQLNDLKKALQKQSPGKDLDIRPFLPN
ncbi:MAG: DUF2723 domain-containing protein [Myxococcales bacterium]|nr:MAG: DUF2723 domain-containing protein [Myxococcales bacterium]